MINKLYLCSLKHVADVTPLFIGYFSLNSRMEISLCLTFIDSGCQGILTGDVLCASKAWCVSLYFLSLLFHSIFDRFKIILKTCTYKYCYAQLLE